MTRIYGLTAASVASLALCSMATLAPEAGAATTPAAPPKPKTVLDNMDSRRFFDSAESATAYLNDMGSTLTDFDQQQFVTNGVNPNPETGVLEFDPAVYTEQMRIMIAVLTKRQDKDRSTVQAIVVTPAPKHQALFDSEAAKPWLAALIDKELNHIAVRKLRAPKDGDDIDLLRQQMPLTLEDFVTSSRADGGILDTFNDLARGIIDAFAKQSKIWSKARLTKPELKAAMASRAYAAEYYPQLEDRGEGKESLFVKALDFGKKVAEAKGMDPAIFDRWISQRNEAKLTGSESDEDEDDIDLDSLTFGETKPTDAAPAADAGAPVTGGEPVADAS